MNPENISFIKTVINVLRCGYLSKLKILFHTNLFYIAKSQFIWDLLVAG